MCWDRICLVHYACVRTSANSILRAYTSRESTSSFHITCMHCACLWRYLYNQRKTLLNDSQAHWPLNQDGTSIPLWHGTNHDSQWFYDIHISYGYAQIIYSQCTFQSKNTRNSPTPKALYILAERSRSDLFRAGVLPRCTPKIKRNLISCKSFNIYYK